MPYQCSLSLQLVRCVYGHACVQTCTNACIFVPQEMLGMTEPKQQPAVRDETSKTPILPHQQPMEMLPVSSSAEQDLRVWHSAGGSKKGAC